MAAHGTPRSGKAPPEAMCEGQAKTLCACGLRVLKTTPLACAAPAASATAGAATAESVRLLQASQEPCFPACMKDEPEKMVGFAVRESTEETREEGMTTRQRRRSGRARRPSESESNQQSHELDLEEAAVDVLSPTKAVKVIEVDYEDAGPARSRVALLMENDGSKGDCAPEACRPLDTLVPSFGMAHLSIEDLVGDDPQQRPLATPKTPTQQRRGKSVILSSSGVIPTDPADDGDAALSRKTRAMELKTEVEEAPVVEERCSSTPKLCLCEVRLHTTSESCWIVSAKSVYDVTGVLDRHPGGTRSILRKAGGFDCYDDMQFHSKAARRKLEKCFIGKLQPCGEGTEADGGLAACSIM
ncbi:hypothetical protein Poli38472_012141 [Pythium oligandrum]|uniref:Cytochrome b5 heme-binding domain-containing protein n=1 Tax=Pythium oligandrum TaxID=41045 RepID=A0A8K1CQT0_PYTOL|nr:hypothetical protein Poli38472_012141 [Pythium oligandrum]|eukprot:TMW67025.1 hypothetical protein Poli38472_012141 [Pythium oligandrum]